jgi:hypothetical protein
LIAMDSQRRTMRTIYRWRRKWNAAGRLARLTAAEGLAYQRSAAIRRASARPRLVT